MQYRNRSNYIRAQKMFLVLKKIKNIDIDNLFIIHQFADS